MGEQQKTNYIIIIYHRRINYLFLFNSIINLRLLWHLNHISAFAVQNKNGFKNFILVHYNINYEIN